MPLEYSAGSGCSQPSSSIDAKPSSYREAGATVGAETGSMGRMRRSGSGGMGEYSPSQASSETGSACGAGSGGTTAGSRSGAEGGTSGGASGSHGRGAAGSTGKPARVAGGA